MHSDRITEPYSVPHLAAISEQSLVSASSAKHTQKAKIVKKVWRCVACEKKKKNNSLASRRPTALFSCQKRFGCYDDPMVIILLGCALMPGSRNRLRNRPTHAAQVRWGKRWDNGGVWKECGRPYLVGSAGGVESVCSANKQRVVVLLQEHLDEIVTLVLQKSKKKREERNVHLLKRELSLWKARCVMWPFSSLCSELILNQGARNWIMIFRGCIKEYKSLCIYTTIMKWLLTLLL